jgi:hypothetical protein
MGKFTDFLFTLHSLPVKIFWAFTFTRVIYLSIYTSVNLLSIPGRDSFIAIDWAV